MKRGSIEQILLLGDKEDSAKLTPIVRHKAVEFERIMPPGGVLSKRLVFRNGWALIKLARGRRKIIIYTESGGVQYEFFTSEGIYGRTLASPPYYDGNPTGEYFICGRGSNHTFGNATKSVPLVELCGQCPPGVPTWPKYDCNDITGEELMRTNFAWQNQRAYEYVWWPNNNGSTFVTSAAGSVQGFSSVGRMSRANFSSGYSALNFIQDSGWDLRPSLYSADSAAATAHGAPDLPAPQWWRRACVQTVGGQTFFVMNDATGAWHFWPAGLYEGVLVPNALVKSVSPSYPSWVEGGVEFWNFNKDGTKAVCTPYERFDPPLTKGGDTVYKDLDQGWLRVTPTSAPGFLQACYEDLPGLLEISISIVVDPDTGDWTPSVNVTREERFSVTGKYYVAADYLFGDDRLPYSEDTLVMMHFDCYIDDTHGYFRNGGNYWPDDFSGVTNNALVIDAWNSAAEVPFWDELHRLVTNINVAMEFGTQYTGWDITGDQVADFYGYTDSIYAYTISEFDYASSVVAVNLRSLSWVQAHQAPNVGLTDFLYGTSTYAYGALVEEDLDVGLVIPVWSIAGFTRVDAGKPELWSNAYHAVLDTWPTIAISPHPYGHWAVATNVFPPGEATGRMVDIVNVRRRGADVRTTHQALYNAAFNDTRTKQYYIDLGDPEGADAPTGTFRTFGIWRDKGR